MSNLNFGANCYLLTSRDVLMPAKFLGANQDGLVEVESPNGRIYTCNPANVYGEQEGRIMLFHRRAEQLAAQGYKIALRSNGTFRVYNPRKHGVTGGYIVTASREATSCTCPAFAKEGLCKHQMGVTVLLWDKAHEAEATGKILQAETYANLALQAA